MSEPIAKLIGKAVYFKKRKGGEGGSPIELLGERLRGAFHKSENKESKNYFLVTQHVAGWVNSRAKKSALVTKDQS